MAKMPQETFTPAFLIAIVANAVLCVGSAILAVVIIYCPPHNEAAGDKLFWIFEHILLMSAGAFIGLLGGKAGRPH